MAIAVSDSKEPVGFWLSRLTIRMRLYNIQSHEKVKMKSNTIEEEIVFDVGSLYAQLQELEDRRKPRGISIYRTL